MCWDVGSNGRGPLDAGADSEVRVHLLTEICEGTPSMDSSVDELYFACCLCVSNIHNASHHLPTRTQIQTHVLSSESGMGVGDEYPSNRRKRELP